MSKEVFKSKSGKEYFIDYCDHCDQFVIYCPECKNHSCNGGGCDSCIDDFEEFGKLEWVKV